MKRRDFIKKLGGGTLATGVLGASASSLFIRPAHAASGKTLVVVFQRGGNDGLNTVVPYGDGDYYRLRPSIAIARPGSGAGAALDLDGFYGLHPAMHELAPLYHEGHMAVFPAVQYPRASRSHFLGQTIIETGAPDLAPSGWLARHLKSTSSSARLRAASLGGTLAESLRGGDPVPSMTSIDGMTLSQDSRRQDAVVSRLNEIYTQSPTDSRKHRSSMLKSGKALWRNYETLSEVGNSSTTGPGAAEYPNSLLGRQLRDIARLIKSDISLEVATVNSGDWDTHIKQGGAQGRQASLLANLSGSIASFVADLGNRMNDVQVLVMTEFGRTAAENANGGTDHGHASAWFAVGGSVNGGIYDGKYGWPGLSSEDLYLYRYLAHTVDYRSIMAEALAQHLANPQVSALFPDFRIEPIGFA